MFQSPPKVIDEKVPQAFGANSIKQSSLETGQKEEVKSRPISANQVNIIINVNSNVNFQISQEHHEEEELEML